MKPIISSERSITIYFCSPGTGKPEEETEENGSVREGCGENREVPEFQNKIVNAFIMQLHYFENLCLTQFWTGK